MSQGHLFGLLYNEAVRIKGSVHIDLGCVKNEITAAAGKGNRLPGTHQCDCGNFFSYIQIQIGGQSGAVLIQVEHIKCITFCCITIASARRPVHHQTKLQPSEPFQMLAYLGVFGGAGMWTVNVKDATKNENHMLEVEVNNGYSRIDYAVVNRFWEKDAASTDTYKVTVNAGPNGSAEISSGNEVSAGGSAVIQITPNEGYEIENIAVNNVSVPIPENDTLVLKNIRQHTTVQVTFRKATFAITIDVSGGGTLTPSAFTAREGVEVTLTPAAYDGYELDGAVTVKKADNTAIDTTVDEDGIVVYNACISSNCQ